ncbi:hypothetical protein Efla_003958 [Eimeria flavescens]
MENVYVRLFQQSAAASDLLVFLVSVEKGVSWVVCFFFLESSSRPKIIRFAEIAEYQPFARMKMKLLSLFSFLGLTLLSSQAAECKLNGPRRLEQEIDLPPSELEAEPRFEYLGEVLLQLFKDFFLDEVLEELKED